MSARTEAVEQITVALAEFGELVSDEAGLAVGTALPDLSDAQLLETVVGLGRVMHAVQRSLSQFAAEVDHRSGKHRGPSSLAKKEGYASSTQLIAGITGLAPAIAARCVRVGSAIHRRRDWSTGGFYPAHHQVVADAIGAGELTVEAADEISAALDRASRGGTLDLHRKMEAHLVKLAPQFTLTDLRTLCLKGMDTLDPDGIEPREARQREDRSLTITAMPGGAQKLVWLLPSTQAALVVNGIYQVARQLDASTGPEGARHWPEALGQIDPNQVADGCTPDGAHFDLNGRPVGWAANEWAQKLSDAAFAFFDHATQCDSTGTGVPRLHLVVRMTLDTLRGGDGAASVDGGGVMSAKEARRYAATAGIIPAVLGSDSELLDLGREERLFTRPQRIALFERDGACSWPGCGSMPGWTHAHHINWWEHDAGETNIDNGAMLCSSHHLRIHDNGWRIEVRPPDSDPNGPPVPHFIAPATAFTAQYIPGVYLDPKNGRWTLVGGRVANLSLVAAAQVTG